MKTAQASIELFVLIAFFLVFLIPIVFLMMNLSGEKASEASLAQAQQLGRRMADLADQVYMQGDGAQKVEPLFFPANIVGLEIGAPADAHEIVITVSTYSGETDIVFMTTTALSTGTPWSAQPNLYLGAGMKKVRVYNTNDADNSVAIDYAP